MADTYRGFILSKAEQLCKEFTDSFMQIRNLPTSSDMASLQFPEHENPLEHSVMDANRNGYFHTTGNKTAYTSQSTQSHLYYNEGLESNNRLHWYQNT